MTLSIMILNILLYVYWPPAVISWIMSVQILGSSILLFFLFLLVLFLLLSFWYMTFKFMLQVCNILPRFVICFFSTFNDVFFD